MDETKAALAFWKLLADPQIMVYNGRAISRGGPVIPETVMRRASGLLRQIAGPSSPEKWLILKPEGLPGWHSWTEIKQLLASGCELKCVHWDAFFGTRGLHG